jgi:hypothetical protein
MMIETAGVICMYMTMVEGEKSRGMNKVTNDNNAKTIENDAQ